MIVNFIPRNFAGSVQTVVNINSDVQTTCGARDSLCGHCTQTFLPNSSLPTPVHLPLCILRSSPRVGPQTRPLPVRSSQVFLHLPFQTHPNRKRHRSREQHSLRRSVNVRSNLNECAEIALLLAVSWHAFSRALVCRCYLPDCNSNATFALCVNENLRTLIHSRFARKKRKVYATKQIVKMNSLTDQGKLLHRRKRNSRGVIRRDRPSLLACPQYFVSVGFGLFPHHH